MKIPETYNSDRVWRSESSDKDIILKMY